MNFSFDKYLFVSLCLFALVSFLSIAGANVFLGVSTLFFLIILFKNKSTGIISEDKEYFKVIVVFAVALLASALLGGNIGAGLKLWGNFFIWRFMPFIIVLVLLTNKEHANKLLEAAFVGFFVNCLYVIYQGIFVYKLNIASGRAAGFVGYPMTLAGWVCILLPVLLVFIFRRDISKKILPYCLLLFIIGCIATVFNSTRGAWLALAIVLPLVGIPFVFESKKNFLTFVSIIILIVTALLSSPSFMSRVNSITDIKTNWSNKSRLVIWDTAYGMFKEHPVFGVGLGTFRPLFKSKFVVTKDMQNDVEMYNSYLRNKKANELTSEQKNLSKKELQRLAKVNRKAWEFNHLNGLGHAHNNFIQMLAENGLVGFAGYIFAFGFILWKNIKNYFLNKNPYALMIVGSTGALMLQGFTEYNFGNSSVMKMYWFVLACLIVLARYYNKENAEKETK